MTKDEFSTRIKAELTNLKLVKPDLVGPDFDPTDFKINRLKNGFSAYVGMPIGKRSFQLEWRSSNPKKIVLMVEFQRGLYAKFQKVATFTV